jgi:hypothetical protein
MKVQLKPQHHGAVIYLDGYRNDLKCIGITIPSNYFCNPGNAGNVSSNDMMKVIVKPIMESLFDNLDIDDVTACFVTSVEELIDCGFVCDEEELIEMINDEPRNGYGLIFEVVE